MNRTKLLRGVALAVLVAAASGCAGQMSPTAVAARADAMHDRGGGHDIEGGIGGTGLGRGRSGAL